MLKKTFYRAAPVLCTLLLLSQACGEETSTTSDTNPDVDPLDVSFETGDWEVAGGDVFECFYTDFITDKELAVRGGRAFTQNEGQHHITVYYTEEQQPVGHHTCQDSEMLNWRQVAGAGGGEGDSDYALPDGMAMRVPAGVQMVFQVHYINTTGAPYTRNDGVTLDVVNPDDVVEFANIFVTLDANFQIDPHAMMSSVTECEVAEDLQVVILLGHMHEWGTSYKLERLAADGSVTDLLYSADPWYPEYSSHPPVTRYTMDAPLVLPKGTRLRQSCSWTNTEDAELVFPREMCLSFMNYFPDKGEQIVPCTPVSPSP